MHYVQPHGLRVRGDDPHFRYILLVALILKIFWPADRPLWRLGR